MNRAPLLISLARRNISSSSQALAGKKSESSTSSKSASAMDLKNIEPPSYIFKKVEGQVGPGASKSAEYKNPEYFSYHDMSFNDMEVVMAKLRLPQPSAQQRKD